VSKRLFNCPVKVVVGYFACAADSFQLSRCRLSYVSVYSARGCRAVGVASWVRAMTVGTHSFVGAVVPILPLVSIRAVPTVYTAGYFSAARSVAVALTAWVVALYSRVFVDCFGEFASTEETERADWLLVRDNPGSKATVVGPVP
jgi:hypothetical protein